MIIHLKQKTLHSSVHLLLKVHCISSSMLSIHVQIILGACTGMVIRIGDETVMGRIAALGKSLLDLRDLL